MTLIERLTNLDNFESERLIYRHATEADAADMFEMFHNPEVLKWIHVPMPESIEHTLEISIKKFHLADPLGKYVIVEKATNKMIGSMISDQLRKITLLKSDMPSTMLIGAKE